MTGRRDEFLDRSNSATESHSVKKWELSRVVQDTETKKQSDLFPKLQMLPIDNSEKSEKEKREIPRRRKPVVQ